MEGGEEDDHYYYDYEKGPNGRQEDDGLIPLHEVRKEDSGGITGRGIM